MQQRLKSAARSARARIIPTEFLLQLFITADNAIAALYVSFGRAEESYPTRVEAPT
jgi:hypothetical protein